jgi:hypothetical protein
MLVVGARLTRLVQHHLLLKKPLEVLLMKVTYALPLVMPSGYLMKWKAFQIR